MDHVFLLLSIFLPCVVIFLTGYLIIRKYLEISAQRQFQEIRAEARKTILPLRLQAYERTVLYLERISPNSLVMRTYKAGMSARLLQSDLVRAIREEYEHNMTQQVYVSPALWLLVRNAKEETIRLINVAAASLPADASGLDLSQIIFESGARIEKMPTDVAIQYAKEEAQKLF